MNMEFFGASLGYHRTMKKSRYHHQCGQTGIIFFDAAAKHAHLNFSYPSSEVIPEKCRKMQ
jgi:hypothetical protein